MAQIPVLYGWYCGAHPCQQHYEVATLAADHLSDTVQTVCSHGMSSGTGPVYLPDTITPILSIPGHRRLRSAIIHELDVPRTVTKF